MTALPTSVSFTDSGVTEAQFKTAITNQREFLAGLLGTSGDVPDAITALGTLGSSTLTKSSAYTVVAADRGALIECTGTFTLSLTAAATLAEGFIFAVFNKGTGIITIDPASTEQINGASTLAIAANSWAIINCTGTAFNSLGSVPATGSLIGYQVFTASGTYTKATNNPSFVIIEVQAGGGGSAGSGIGATNGGTGGTSSFGALVSASGGTGVSGSPTGGLGSSGDINLRGGNTGYTKFYFGHTASVANTGGGVLNASGGGGYASKLILASSIAASETVTVGAGGTAGTGSGGSGQVGSSGVVIVWEYK